jgi:Sec7-like guanine-nucleotide exchange factor
MMLQTDAHSDHVSSKMDAAAFTKLASNIKVHGKTSLPAAFVGQLYASVTSNPLAIHHSIKNQAELYDLIH